MNRQMEIDKFAAETTNDPRWLLLVARDKESDGKFFYSVKTTGVYCRPSCAARLARPENVRFYTTTAAAEKAGFRACKRCKPAGLSLTEANTAKIEKVCRLIEYSEETPSLEKLAKHAGMSVFHLHRTFKAITGLTPSGYGAAHRTKRVRKTLGKSQSVTDAIYDAGFNSNSRFYESANEALGMTPTSFRDGGVNTVIHFAIAECSLGSILVAKSERGVCAVLMVMIRLLLVRDLQDQFPKAELVGDESGYEDLVAKAIGLIERPGVGLDLPLDIRERPFSKGFGRHCSKSLSVRPRAMRMLRRLSVCRRLYGRSPGPAERIRWPSQSHAIVLSEMMERCLAIAGAWSASEHC